MESGLGDTLSRELDHLESHWPDTLPDGVCHADLFPDNVFFTGTEVGLQGYKGLEQIGAESFTGPGDHA